MGTTLKNKMKGTDDVNFSLTPELVKSVEKETIKKTGSKFLTKEQAKECLVKEGVVGKVLTTFDKWLKKNTKEAVLTLGCGAAATLATTGMLGPAVGISVATVIATSLLKRKQQAYHLMQGENKCNR